MTQDTAQAVPGLAAADSLYARLRAACREDWQAFTNHAFVRRLAEGTLSQAAFRHYLGQDYLFLIQFARAYALAVYKSEHLSDMREAASGMAGILDEMGVHTRLCESWGLSPDELGDLPEDPATVANTRYVLERGQAGDILDLHVALAPCVIGYAEIGGHLLRDPATNVEDNAFAEWITMFAGDDYQDMARRQVDYLDRLMQERGGPGRMDSLVQTFRQATRLEAAVFDAGLAAGQSGG